MGFGSEGEGLCFSSRLIVILKSFFAPEFEILGVRWILPAADWSRAHETNGEETEKLGASELLVATGLNGGRAASRRRAVCSQRRRLVGQAYGGPMRLAEIRCSTPALARRILADSGSKRPSCLPRKWSRVTPPLVLGTFLFLTPGQLRAGGLIAGTYSVVYISFCEQGEFCPTFRSLYLRFI